MFKLKLTFSLFLYAAFLFVVAGFAMSCKSTEQPITEWEEFTDTGYYRNITGSDLIRDQITDSFESVRRIQNTIIYRTYQFDAEQLPRRSQLEGRYFSDISRQIQVDNHSTAGTATVLYSQGGRALLLTAAHTVVQPDTIWHYRSTGMNQPDPVVEAVSVKESVTQFVFSDGGIVMIEIVAYDTRKDLALMISQDEVVTSDNLRRLRYPAGTAARLEWGDLVFAMGYPRGVQMVSQGVVSRSTHPLRSVILDLSINRGFSGGPAFAVRNDGSGLEWVGVVTSAMGEREFYLGPDFMTEEEFNPNLPYSGDLFIKSSQRIYYGITNVVDIEQIRAFMAENRDHLRIQGISIEL